MTDLLIFRLNQVPEKNYVAFLNLLGIKLRAPRAAKALLQFTLVEGTARQKVPRGSQVSTPQSGDDSTVSFETDRDLVVTSVLLDRAVSYYEDTYAEYEAIFNQIIANANANAKVMEAQLIAQGQAVYQQALARGMSDAAAQQAAVKTVGNIASTNSITNSFGHDLTMKISNNWPNGSGALYQYSDGSVGNWATRY